MKIKILAIIIYPGLLLKESCPYQSKSNVTINVTTRIEPTAVSATPTLATPLSTAAHPSNTQFDTNYSL